MYEVRKIKERASYLLVRFLLFRCPLAHAVHTGPIEFHVLVQLEHLTSRERTFQTYPLPVAIIDMTLLQSSPDLFLHFGCELIIPVKEVEIAVNAFF